MNGYNRGSLKPPQNISLKDKLRDGSQWAEDCHEYYLGQAGMDDRERDEMLFAYSIVNGEIGEEYTRKYFSFVENPYNSENPVTKGFPARIRNLSIIRPNVELLRGSFRQMPLDFQVKVVSDSSYTIEDEMKKDRLKKIMTDIVAAMLEGREDTSYSHSTMQDFKDIRGKAATIAIQRIILGERIIERFSELFFDFIVAGRACSLKEYSSKVHYMRLSPFDVNCIKSENTKFYEDGEACVAYEKITGSELIERYGDYIKDDEDILEALDLEQSFVTAGISGFDYSSYRDRNFLHDNFTVSHCFWKTTVEEYVVASVNEFGELIERVERETEKGKYRPTEEEEILETYRVNYVWHTIRLETTGITHTDTPDRNGFMLYSGPMEEQMTDSLNPSRVKLPINGMDYSDNYTNNTSPTRLMIPYEILYRIIWWRLEFTIAKNRGKFVLLDQNVIPTGEGKEGWDEELFMYNVETMSIGLIDRNQAGVDRTFNQYQVIDLSMFEHIRQYIDLLNFIKYEADAILGITPARKGLTKATDTATGIQNSNFNSAIISEEIFARFSEFIERELAGLLDLSRYAVFNDGELVGASEEEKELVKIDGLKYFNSSYSLFITSSVKDSQALQKYKLLAQEYAQNGSSPQTIADIITAESMSQVKERLRLAEEQSMKAQDRRVQQEQAAASRIEKEKIAIQKEFEQMRNLLDIAKINAEWDRKDNNEHIKGSYNIASFQGTLDVNDNSVPDSVDIQKGLNERLKVENEKNLKSRELDIKEKEIKSKERIEKLKARTALENKVSGEE